MAELQRCAKCGEPVERRVQVNGEWWMLPDECSCQKKERLQREAREAARHIEDLRTRCLPEKMYRGMTFQKDGFSDSTISKVCRRYVDEWEKNKANHIGILFHGGVGTGKTFYAACIANALIDRGISARLTSIPRIINSMFGADNKQYIIDEAVKAPLLILDDIGTERNTEYEMEQAYQIVNRRCVLGLPLIVTTNIPYEAMKAEQNQERKRLYSRIIEMCPIVLAMDGEDKRLREAETRREVAREIIKGKTGC